MALNGLSPAKLDAHPVLGVDGRLVRELVTAGRAHTLPVEVRADEGDEHLHGAAGTPAQRHVEDKQTGKSAGGRQGGAQRPSRTGATR